MRIFTSLGLLSLVSANFLPERDFETNDYFTLHIRDTTPEDAADALGLEYLGPLGSLPNHYHFFAKKGEHNAHDLLDGLRLKRRKRDISEDKALAGILWSQQSKLKPRHVKRDHSNLPGLGERYAASLAAKPADETDDPVVVKKRIGVKKQVDIQDPIFDEQWHLINVHYPGHDLNVTGLWMDGITGKNVTVSIIDDGLDMNSDDLKDNYLAEGSYDFNDKGEEPKPRLSDDRHGTRCAGEIAAGRNNVCGVGVAYDAKVSGIRILSKPISDEDEALAINYKMDINDIYSCSWGPPDDGTAMEAPGVLIKAAMLNAIQNGRHGLGNIFVYAAGNGAAFEDNCNFDGYTNSIYSITVGAVDRKGQHPYYSEKCSANLVVAYSSGSGDAIHTTDVGANQCYSAHGGTSAAAPLGAGIFALALSVRPDLSWRDMQYLCVETAVPLDVDNPSLAWQDTYIGKKYSHSFAYGKLDAYALVEAAKTWKPVKKQAWYKTPWQHVKHPIPEGTEGLASTFEVTKEALKEANLERLEHITLTMNAEHERRGDLSVDLISPKGMVSHLSVTRRSDESNAGYKDWTFMTVVHWGEPGIGKWTVVVKDTNENQKTGNLTDWRMIMWGESIDESKQELYPMPTKHDDDDHDREDGTVSTTAVTPDPTSALTGNPSDHPERPVNEKPEAETKPSAEASDSAKPHDGFSIPAIFPHLPVSARTQVWVAGALVLILIFCCGLGAYFFIMRRRRKIADGRADYEFEIVPGDERGGGRRGGNGRGRRRGGELYDAFAGESDEEGLEGLVGASDEDDSEAEEGDEEKARYRDSDEEKTTEK